MDSPPGAICATDLSLFLRFEKTSVIPSHWNRSDACLSWQGDLKPAEPNLRVLVEGRGQSNTKTSEKIWLQSQTCCPQTHWEITLISFVRCLCGGAVTQAASEILMFCSLIFNYFFPCILPKLIIPLIKLLLTYTQTCQSPSVPVYLRRMRNSAFPHSIFSKTQ